MPVWMIGYSIPYSAQMRVRSAGWSSTTRHLLETEATRVDLVDEFEFYVGRRPRRGDIARDDEREPGRGNDLVHTDTGMDRRETHRVVGRLEVEDPEIRDDRGNPVIPVGLFTGVRRTQVANPADHV